MIVENADFGSGNRKYITEGLGRKILHTCANLFLGLDRDTHTHRGVSDMCAGKSKKRGKGAPPPALLFVLRQVITERREDHIVDSVGSRGDTLTTRCP